MNKQYENEINQYYRHKTARRRKRLRKKNDDRKILALDRERRTLYTQRRNLGWMELDPPVARGWKRYFVLREDVARSRHAPFFEKILEKINTVQYCSRKDFMEKEPDNKKRRAVMVQGLLELSESSFRKKNFSDKEKSFFEMRTRRKQNRKFIEQYYVFKETWRFAFRIRRHYITKVKVLDEAVNARICGIDKYLECRHLTPRLHKLRYGNYRWSYYNDNKRIPNPLKNQPLHEILGALAEEK
ncbi:hypothetical protein ACTHGU_17030 [Chitinophagaceae bacterium MMS25-I14]